MIRRLLSALLVGWMCATLVAPADAKLLVVMARSEYDLTLFPDRFADLIALQELVLGTLQRLHADYDVVSASTAKTEFVRTGAFTYNFGLPSAYVTQYDAAILVGVAAASAANTRGLNPDSLTLMAAAPTIPLVFLPCDGDFTTTTGKDTTGVLSGGIAGMGYSHYPTTDPSLVSDCQIADEADVLTPAQLTPYGYRVLIRTASTARTGTAIFQTTPIPCINCDSLNTGSGADTAQVWTKLNSNKAGAAPIVLTEMSHFAATGMDPIPFLSALAWLDSTSGNKALGASVTPIRMGFRISGGFRRSSALAGWGVVSTDTTALKASIDSLASLRVPFAVGVNVDSLQAYAGDRAWWDRASGYVHYAPENWGGVFDSTKGGNASWQQPCDPLGRWRNRIMLGDDSGAGRDTSLKTLVRANYFKVDSAFGGRTDHALFAADDDWVPKNIRAYNEGPGRDSLLSELADAGVKNIVVNCRQWESNPKNSPHNPRSLQAYEGWLPIKYGRRAGERMALIATPGYADSGSVAWISGSGAVGQGARQQQYRIEAFWRGLLTGNNRSKFVGSGENVWTPDSLNSGCHVYTIHAGDLGSGTRADAATLPTRPGWWQIKWIVNGAKTVNKLAGRTLIQIDYPENITP